MVLPVQQFQILSPEQANPFAYGLKQGVAIPGMLAQTFAQQLENQKLKTLLPFIAPQAQAELTGKQLQNKWNPQLWQSEIGLRGAQSKEALALANLHGIDIKQRSMMIDMLKNAMSPSYGGQQESPSEGQQPGATMGNYGVERPQPNQQDLVNKTLFGVDTFTPKQQFAQEQIKKQADSYLGKVMDTNLAAENAAKFSNLLNQYNYWMDEGTATGPVGGHLPALGSSSQTVNNLISQVSLGAIEDLRNSMGSGQFSVADLNAAMGMKPQRTWTEGTRDFYTNFTNGVRDRLNQKAQFYNVAATKKIPIQYADALWSSYQNKYPIVTKSGNKITKYEGDEWQSYLTPEALNKISVEGKFNPTEGKSVSEQDVKDTMKATGLNRKDVLKELLTEGYNISGF